MDIHVVRAGETVSSVAARYGVPAGILAGVNGVAPDAPLAVGQTLVVRHPRELHTVASGESVYSIALRYGLSVRTLYQNNPALGGRSALYPGQTLVIAYDDTPTRTLAVNAYSYPFIRGGLLDAALPYLTYLTPFTYGINADGTLLPLADEWLLAAAGQYRTAALMHLSTLTEEGHFDNARSTLILEDADAQDALVQSILETVQARHYFGLDVDFELNMCCPSSARPTPPSSRGCAKRSIRSAVRSSSRSRRKRAPRSGGCSTRRTTTRSSARQPTRCF